MRDMGDIDPVDLVETIREGVLVLDPDLTVRFVNRSFCHIFAVAPEHTVGRKLYEIGNGQWDIPELRAALDTVISEKKTIEAFEVEHVFPSIGRRIMLLNAREVYQPGNGVVLIFLAIEDVTERVRLEREHAAAHERIGMLLQELTHRVKNSLQFIASMVMIEARSIESAEGKAALERVSHRIVALGQFYSKLTEADTFEAVDAATYLNELCRNLIASVYQDGDAFIMLKTDIESELLPTERAIPIGLIVNELVTNSVKYGFPGEAQGTVTVTLKRVPGALRLTVADDGQGLDPLRADSGLGGRKRNNPMQFALHRALKCRARTRSGQPCQAPAMSNGRCRMHGGSSPGAPKGNKNAFKHGRYTADAIARRRKISGLLRAMKALVKASE